MRGTGFNLRQSFRACQVISVLLKLGATLEKGDSRETVIS